MKTNKEYSLFYYVPWPDSQRYLSIDENSEYVYNAGDDAGAFIDKDWLDQIEKDGL